MITKDLYPLPQNIEDFFDNSKKLLTGTFAFFGRHQSNDIDYVLPPDTSSLIIEALRTTDEKCYEVVTYRSPGGHEARTIYIRIASEEKLINLILTRTDQEYGSWCEATDTMKSLIYSNSAFKSVMKDRDLRISLFKKFRAHFYDEGIKG